MAAITEPNLAAIGMLKAFAEGRRVTNAGELADLIKPSYNNITTNMVQLDVNKLIDEAKQFQTKYGGQIDAKYAQVGGASGVLGKALPLAFGFQHYVFPDGQSGMKLYEHGAIVVSAKTGVHEIHGEIFQKWEALWQSGLFLGYPSTDESGCPDHVGRYNHFEGAWGFLSSIYWTPQTGARDIYGPIRSCWESLGWERGFLGYPVTDQVNDPFGVGQFIHFQHNGAIYWSPNTGAHEVHGAIRQKYESMGWGMSVLGYPTTNESGCRDGVGRYNHFERGSIYWTPKLGAHEVHGPIRERWKDLGWEKSSLGYPITDQLADPDKGSSGQYSRFEKGYVSWAGVPTLEKEGKVYQIRAQEHLDGVPYFFMIHWIRACTIRSGHFGAKGFAKDQLTLSLEVRINGQTVKTRNDYIGDWTDWASVRDEIIFPVDDPTARVTLSFVVTNIGSQDTSVGAKILSKVNDWADEQASKGADVVGALVGGAVGGPLGAVLGAAVVEAAKALYNFGAFSQDACDGVVAADVIQASAAAINDYIGNHIGETKDFPNYAVQKHYLGSASPGGCGANSDYEVDVRVGFKGAEPQ